MKKGKLITFEGGDGGGKSSLIEKLEEIHPDWVFTREPGGSEYAEKIRKLIFEGNEASAITLFFLFLAARNDHIEKIILPALRDGKTVVSDRFELSTYAYQLKGQEAPSVLEKYFWQFHEDFITNVLGAENIHYIWLDIDPEVGLARVASREGEITHFDERDIAFHQRVRSGGLEFIARINKNPESGGCEQLCHIIDASQDKETVFLKTNEIISKIIENGSA